MNERRGGRKKKPKKRETPITKIDQSLLREKKRKKGKKE